MRPPSLMWMEGIFVPLCLSSGTMMWRFLMDIVLFPVFFLVMFVMWAAYRLGRRLATDDDDLKDWG